MPGPRIARDLLEMTSQLETQLRLLYEYMEKAFSQAKPEFLPEVAGKLRILLVRSKHNKPLLFEVAGRLNYVPRVILDGPPIRPPLGKPGPGDEIDLDRFFDLEALGIKTSAGFLTMTKRELIRAWCE